MKILTEHYGVPAKLIAAKDKFAGKEKSVTADERTGRRDEGVLRRSLGV